MSMYYNGLIGQYLRGLYFPKPKINNELDGIDIVKEMELIKQKKSKLSSRLRKMVPIIFEENNTRKEVNSDNTRR